jgi:hypothetical protein
MVQQRAGGPRGAVVGGPGVAATGGLVAQRKRSGDDHDSSVIEKLEKV